MDRESCGHRLRVESRDFHPGGTCLRVETMEPADRCALKLTSHARAREISVYRWIGSGGSPISICHPCDGRCPLNVEGEGGIMSNRKHGPCPVCRKLNGREEMGPVRCRECGLEYNLV